MVQANELKAQSTAAHETLQAGGAVPNSGARQRGTDSGTRITVMPNPLAAHTYIFNVEFASGDVDTLESLLVREPQLFLDRIRASLPTVTRSATDNPLDATLGPFYRGADVAKWRNRKRQQISAEATSHKLLRLTTTEGDLLFPAFQFQADGSPVEGLKKVYDALVPAVYSTEWEVAQWLTGPVESANLGSSRRIDAMREGNAQTVIEVATRLKLRVEDEAA